MKIAIIGYSGSGKSTLAKKLSQRYAIPKLHLDTLRFLPGWIDRPDHLMATDVRQFLDTNKDWVIDGNYSQYFYKERMAKADIIIWMNFPRWISLWRAFKRWRQFKNKSRDSMAEGCIEKMDWEFIRWILWDGRQKSARDRYAWVKATYGDKLVTLRSQKEIDQFLKDCTKKLSA